MLNIGLKLFFLKFITCYLYQDKCNFWKFDRDRYPRDTPLALSFAYRIIRKKGKTLVRFNTQSLVPIVIEY
jgi:hypothetical protein